MRKCYKEIVEDLLCMKGKKKSVLSFINQKKKKKKKKKEKNLMRKEEMDKALEKFRKNIF